MIQEALINPKSIVIVGGSNNISKPGGRLVQNIVSNKFNGKLYVVNKKEKSVADLPTFQSVEELPEDIDLAILAIPAEACVKVAKVLLRKGAKAFIIISAGFGELNEKGKALEAELVNIINDAGATLIGPNCIGVLNRNYAGIFTLPVPELSPQGCDLISSSGATAVFIMEAATPFGLRFNQVFSIGNAAQTSAEDILEYLDNSFDPEKSSRIKLLYLEHIKNPKKLYKHARSLIKKGCKIAAIKSGTSQAGARAAFSHTGALSTSEVADRALLRKCGIVYCSSKMELIYVAGIFSITKNIPEKYAVITHAGGSAVLLTDALEKSGLKIPDLSKNKDVESLKSYLHEGSSVNNPIDFLATGTADQLGIIIDYCEHKFNEIDGIIVIFGSPGLFNVKNVYNVLDVKMSIGNKPIFPVLPSIVNAGKEIREFTKKGRINFIDEVELGRALGAIKNTPDITRDENNKELVNKRNLIEIKKILSLQKKNILNPVTNQKILNLIGVDTVKEEVITTENQLNQALSHLKFPVVMKVVGPVHKTDVGGVSLNINDTLGAKAEYKRLMKIQGAEGVLIQEMVSGTELYVGAKNEPGYGNLIMCGLGGIYLEIIKDITSEFTPVSVDTAKKMIHSLKIHPIFEGVRNIKPLNIGKFAEIISRIGYLMDAFPEIKEIDLNPVIAKENQFTCVDARILIEPAKDIHPETIV